MTIRARLLHLLFILAALFLAGALCLRQSEYQRVRQIAETDHRQKSRFFTKILDLKEASLEELAYDDTYWDEMVQFVSSRDPKWAAQNLDPALPTHMIDGIWIYNPRLALVYSTCSHGHDALKPLPLPAETLARAYAGHHFFHFFLPTRQGVLEIRGAEIHATNDERRTGRSFGLFLSGRLWDAAYLKTLSDLTASRVSLRLLRPGEAMPVPGDDGDDTTNFYRPLPGWGGQTLACLHLASESRSVRLFRASSARMMALILAFLVVFLVLLSACILQWVSSPLQSLARALGTHDLGGIRRLQAHQTEFGALARLIGRFFAQNAELEREILERRQIEAELYAAHDQLERRVAERTAELADANHLLENAYTATITGWSRAMDLRDHETEGHCQRVTEMTLRLARSLGLSEDDLVPIRWGALLHDIGKMGIPDGILRKPGPLTEEEWREMRRHPSYAYEMLAPITFLHSSLDIPWCHHEKWDGSGYPRGLAGEAIPLPARIFALVDVWDALRSDRPYRRGWPPERVVDHIRGLAGTHFDPEVVPEFLALIETEGEAPGAGDSGCALAA